MHRRVRDAVYGSSPFDGFPAEEYASDLQGWNSEHPIFEEVIRSRRPRRILEVGTWKGASAIHMARLCRRHAISCEEIVCVDTWPGDANTILVPDSDGGQGRPSFFEDGLRRRFGYPQLYYVFLRNVVDAGVQDLITPLPLSSDAAFFTLHQLGYTADFIYIDASHEYEVVATSTSIGACSLRAVSWSVTTTPTTTQESSEPVKKSSRPRERHVARRRQSEVFVRASAPGPIQADLGQVRWRSGQGAGRPSAFGRIANVGGRRSGACQCDQSGGPPRPVDD